MRAREQPLEWPQRSVWELRPRALERRQESRQEQALALRRPLSGRELAMVQLRARAWAPGWRREPSGRVRRRVWAALREPRALREPPLERLEEWPARRPRPLELPLPKQVPPGRLCLRARFLPLHSWR